MNHNFGKLSNNVLTYAPDAVIVTEHHHEEWIDPETGEKHTEDWDTQRGCCPPTAADYLACDSGPWKAIVTAAPSDPAPTGYHYEADGWAEDATTITRQWKVVADPVIPRKFSKLKIYGAIASLDAANSAATWEKVQAWLEGKTVSGMNGWLAFQLAQEISEDHPLFAAWSEEARQLLGLTPEQFETLLNACILEG